MRNKLRPTLVTVDEAAEYCGVAKSTVWTWVANGWLTVAAKEGRRHFYWLDEVLRVDRRARRGEVLADRS